MKNKQVKSNKTEMKNKKLVMELISEYKETFIALAEYDKSEACSVCGVKKIKQITN